MGFDLISPLRFSVGFFIVFFAPFSSQKFLELFDH